MATSQRLPRAPWHRRVLRIALAGLAVIVAFALIAAVTLWLMARTAMGGRVDGARLDLVERSPQWRDGAFRNRRARIDGPFTEMLTEFAFAGSEYRSPTAPVRVLARGVRFVVPLGIGAHLERWGVAPGSVTELDWWGAIGVGGLTFTAMPSRHFSGRGITGQDRTLWAGWVVSGPRHRVYYSGDTALDDTMIEIGTRLGPLRRAPDAAKRRRPLACVPRRW